MAGTLRTEKISRLYNLIYPSGALGYFEDDEEFVVDTALSWSFAELSAQLLQSYRKNPDQENLRIALIYQPLQPREWASASLVFTDDTLRQLYPSPRGHRPRGSWRTDFGRRSTDRQDHDADSQQPVGADAFTEFQKRNREKSIYRGIELLLEYRSPLVPDARVFCPVLFSRNTTLDQYRTDPDIEEVDRKAALPVIEVLNLAGPMPLQQRCTAAIRELNDALHRLAVDKSRRGYPRPRPAAHFPNRTPTSHNVGEQRRLHVLEHRGELLPVAGAAQEKSPRGDDINAHALRRFDRFQNLDHHQLARLFRGNVRSASPGTVLAKRGSRDNWNYYLLRGTVRLKAKDGARFLIDDASPAAHAPLANLRPRMYSVTAVSHVTYLQIDVSFEAEIIATKTSRSA